LSTMVWIVSCHHAAVNFSQYSYSSYGPNHPVNCRRPPPESDKDRIYTEKDFMDMLPAQMIAQMAFSITYTLSQFASVDEEEYLGFPRENMFVETEALRVLNQFQVQLKRVDQLIRERNKERSIPYVFLQPLQIPGSIAI